MTEPDDYVVRFERNRKIGIGVIISILGLGVLFIFSRCGVCAYNCAEEVQEARELREEGSQVATPEQIAEVERAVTALEATLPQKIATWQTAMSGASRLVPRPDLGPCPIRLPLRQPFDASRGGSFNNLDTFSAIAFPGRQGFPHAILSGEQLPATPPRVDAVRSAAARLRERVRRQGRLEDFESMVQSARSLSESWTFDVVLFASLYERPFAAPLGQSFAPGRVRGVAVLYDYRTNGVRRRAPVARRRAEERVRTPTIRERSSRERRASGSPSMP
jgi:hypothetical protein